MPSCAVWKSESRATSCCCRRSVPASTCTTTTSIAEKFSRSPFCHGQEIKTRLDIISGDVEPGDIRCRHGVQFIGRHGERGGRSILLFRQTARGGRSRSCRDVRINEGRLSPVPEPRCRILRSVGGCGV